MSQKKKISIGYLYLVAIYIIGIGVFGLMIFKNGWDRATHTMPPQLLLFLLAIPLIWVGKKLYFRGKGEFKVYQNKDAVTYAKMRGSALNISAEQLGVDPAKLGNLSYGAIMDFMDTENSYFTLVAWANGETSLYGNKGGVIGMGNSKLPNEMARRFLGVVDKHRKAFSPRSDVNIPPLGTMSVILKTGGGNYKITSAMEEALKPESPLFGMWVAARDLIGAIEKTTKPYKLLPDSMSIMKAVK